MAEFQCRVANAAGEIFDRSYSASDEDGLRRDLESQDLMRWRASLRERCI